MPILNLFSINPEELKNRGYLTKLNAYLGLFERMEGLVQDKIITIEQVYYLYGYRLDEIIFNTNIYNVVKEHHHRWQNLIRLIKECREYKQTLHDKGVLSEEEKYEHTALAEKIDSLPPISKDWRDLPHH